jgi:hypothetical protein
MEQIPSWVSQYLKSLSISLSFMEREGSYPVHKSLSLVTSEQDESSLPPISLYLFTISNIM